LVKTIFQDENQLMQKESAQVIQFPPVERQLGIAQITALSNGMPSQCQLQHNQHSLNIISVLDMPHQWQKKETVIVLHNNNRAIVTGCGTAPDNRFNLNIKLHDNQTHVSYSEDATGTKATQCRFLCGANDITFFDTFKYYIDLETLDNNGLWCLSLLGFQLYVK